MLRPITDPVAAIDDPENAVWGLDGNVLSALGLRTGATSTRRSRPPRTSSTRCSRPNASSTRSSSRSRRSPCRDRDGTLHVYSGGQGVWDDRNQIAAVLGVEPEQVTVELVSNGGAFGGKEDMANQAQTALAAWLLQRPVKCTLTPRGVAADPPEAPPDPHRVLSRLRRRRPAHRAAVRA